MNRARTLRWHLVYFHWKIQDKQRARIQVETTRLLAAAVDNEIDGTIKRLTILGRLFSARDADPSLLYEHARGAVGASPGWVLLLAASGDGQGLLRTDVPLGASQTVLVVEDNADERESLRVALELHGHRVLQAGDARSALEQIEAGRPSVALVALTGYGSEQDARRKRASFAT